jgi:hypothetical protein
MKSLFSGLFESVCLTTVSVVIFICLSITLIKYPLASTDGFIIGDNHTDAAVIPQEYLDAVRELDIVFAHASVGSSIRVAMDGMKVENPVRYSYNRLAITGRASSPHTPVPNPVSELIKPGGLFVDGNTHSTHGLQPDLRMHTYEHEWMNPIGTFEGLKDNVDIALMKFCYVSFDGYFNPETGVTKTYTAEEVWNGKEGPEGFSGYRDMMNRLEAQPKKARYVWFTMPLRNAEGYQSTPSRIEINHFNNYVRDYVAGRPDIILFDIANIESDNGRCTKDGMEALCSLYASDNDGHLNPTGARKVAEGFWWMFARIAGWNGGETPANLEVSISATPGVEVTAPDTITLTPSVSGGTTPYQSELWSGDCSGTGEIVLSNVGSYNCTYTVIDANSIESSDSIAVVINPEPVTGLFVDDDYCETCNNDGLDWGVNAFSTITDAVNVASVNDTITVYSGTYVEQILINKSLKLVGVNKNNEGEVYINVPENTNHYTYSGSSFEYRSIVDVIGTGTQFEISGFTIRGLFTQQSVNDFYTAIFVREQANAYIHDNEFYQISNGADSNIRGAVLLLGYNRISDPNMKVGTGRIENNIVGSAESSLQTINFLKSGIVISGEGSSGEIINNFVTANGSTSTFGQNAIEISNKATGSVIGNTAQLATSSVSTSAQGIFISDTLGDIEIRNNTLNGNQNGIQINAYRTAGNVDNISVIIENNAIINNSIGISLVQDSVSSINPIVVSATNNRIEENEKGVKVFSQDGATPTITSSFQNNNIVHSDLSKTGVENDSIYTVDATNNWWGHEEGPSLNSTDNKGLIITGRGGISYIPWVTTPHTIASPVKVSNMISVSNLRGMGSYYCTK